MENKSTENTEEPLKPRDFLVCRNCNSENSFKSKFCNICGSPLKEKYAYNPAKNEGKIRQIFFFFLAMVLLLGLYGYTEWFRPSIETSIWVDVILAIIVLVFAAFNFKETYKLYNISNIKWRVLALLTVGMVGFAFLINFVAGYIASEFLGVYDDDMLWLYRETEIPLLLGILLIGFHPAIFEEMAFRGFLFNNMLNFSRPKAVIITTGILFAFIHFSFISLLWLLPIGLFFGYLRFRYRSLWYSTVAHLVYNSTLVIIEYFKWL